MDLGIGTLSIVVGGNHIKLIQQQLGHSNPSTIAPYLDNLAPMNILEVKKKRE